MMTMLFMSLGLAMAQTLTVTGTVVAEKDGNPIAYEDHFICKYCGEEHFFCSVERVCHICGTPLEPPIKLVCVGSGLPGVNLFNGAEVWSTDVMDEQAGYQLFAVVVSDYDKKYGLRCTGSQTVTLELKNGIVRDFERGDVIPIFLDAKMRVGKYTLQYVGGKTK